MPLPDREGTAPNTWSIAAGSLPPGLTLDACTGQITGAPGIEGLYSFTAKVTDSGLKTGTAELSIRVLAIESTTIFLDDFESGTASTWSGSVPQQ